eukprot:Gregarina_sp_Pseudo_9__905@NODE_1580_length_1480_cov_139_367106_g1465_i0_p1_GENE_NODE_1580_length_1480_cov_139_367106_g1465_i0NODE_1580_length_1480_cov_139_367106_g1465_i0_p1_ORF_typecomplete_len235_score68_89Proteasome/PF00227_26/3_5e34_NODE_1580_length_1480_cov_139_367106_g1465_i06521356
MMMAASSRICDMSTTPEVEQMESVSGGTVLLGVKFVGGVLLATDTRTSTSVVVDASAKKINKVAENVWFARSGAAAHSQFVIRTVQHYLKQYQTEAGGDLRRPPVKAAASLARLIQFNNKAFLHTGLIVGGVDARRGPQIFQLPLGGSVFESNYAVAGSGGPFIAAMLKQEFKPNMSKAEAKELAIKLITIAIHHNASCGGMVRWVAIEEEGSEEGCVRAIELPTEEEYFKHGI